jgi:hypothetical protein
MIAITFVGVDGPHEGAGSDFVFQEQFHLLQQKFTGFYAGTDEILKIVYKNLWYGQTLVTDHEQGPFQKIGDFVQGDEKIHDIPPGIGNQCLAEHEVVDFVHDVIGLGLIFVGLVRKEIKLFTPLSGDARHQGLVKMFQNQLEVFQVGENHFFHLVFFFKEESKHGFPDY